MRIPMRQLTCLPRWLVACALFPLLAPAVHGQPQATIRIDFVEENSEQPIPVRIELRDSKGRSQKVKGAVNRGPWTLIESTLNFKSRLGGYQFEVAHGPQFSSGGGGFNLEKDGEGSDIFRLPRHCDLEQEGWYSGDLLNFVPAAETAKWLPAEDLKMAVTIHSPDPGTEPPATPATEADTPTPPALPATELPASPAPRSTDAAVGRPARLNGEGERWLDSGSYFDARPGSGLLLHGWQPPAAVPAWLPSSQLLVIAKKEIATHAELVGLWQRDCPILLASGRIDSIQVLSDHATRDGRSPIALRDMFNPDPILFKGPRASGQLVEYLYWQVLESGLRIPPSAGSGFGRSSSPLGYNRIYVSTGTAAPTPDLWWQNLRQGQSFVTNGPLLRPTVNGQLPGHLFQAHSGETLALTIGLELTVADPVEYVDVIFNGEALYHARLDEHARRGGRIPQLEVTESGWLIFRVVTAREETYRMAMSAPYYIEFDRQPRISRSAVEIFLRWLDTAADQLDLAEPQMKSASAPFLKAARSFWEDRLQRSNAP
jgi:hypothetical protein